MTMMTTGKQSLLAATIGLVVALNDPAGATTFSYSGYSVVNNQTVTITGPYGFNETVGSGQIVLHGSNGDLPTWCIDIFHFLQGSGTYSLGGPPSNNGSQPPAPASAALSAAQTGLIGALVLYGNTHLGDSYDVSSGTQIAIWQTEYGALGYSFNGSAGANAMAALLLGLPLAPYTGWNMLSSTDGQGLVNSQGLATLVAEPTSVMLLGGALAGFAVIRRRRSAPPGGRTR
jgi:hypothetical protein